MVKTHVIMQLHRPQPISYTESIVHDYVTRPLLSLKMRFESIFVCEPCPTVPTYHCLDTFVVFLGMLRGRVQIVVREGTLWAEEMTVLRLVYCIKWG